LGKQGLLLISALHSTNEPARSKRKMRRRRRPVALAIAGSHFQPINISCAIFPEKFAKAPPVTPTSCRNQSRFVFKYYG
jgi:hypothetical protein